jgi:hypothetical protein
MRFLTFIEPICVDSKIIDGRINAAELVRTVTIRDHKRSILPAACVELYCASTAVFRELLVIKRTSIRERVLS